MAACVGPFIPNGIILVPTGNLPPFPGSPVQHGTYPSSIPFRPSPGQPIASAVGQRKAVCDPGSNQKTQTNPRPVRLSQTHFPQPILSHPTPGKATQRNPIQHHTSQHHTTPHNTTPYNTIQHHTTTARDTRIFSPPSPITVAAAAASHHGYRVEIAEDALQHATKVAFVAFSRHTCARHSRLQSGCPTLTTFSVIPKFRAVALQEVQTRAWRVAVHVPAPQTSGDQVR